MARRSASTVHLGGGYLFWPKHVRILWLKGFRRRNFYTFAYRLQNTPSISCKSFSETRDGQGDSGGPLWHHKGGAVLPLFSVHIALVLQSWMQDFPIVLCKWSCKKRVGDWFPSLNDADGGASLPGSSWKALAWDPLGLRLLWNDCPRPTLRVCFANCETDPRCSIQACVQREDGEVGTIFFLARPIGQARAASGFHLLWRILVQRTCVNSDCNIPKNLHKTHKTNKVLIRWVCLESTLNVPFIPNKAFCWGEQATKVSKPSPAGGGTWCHWLWCASAGAKGPCLWLCQSTFLHFAPNAITKYEKNGPSLKKQLKFWSIDAWEWIV